MNLWEKLPDPSLSHGLLPPPPPDTLHGPPTSLKAAQSGRLTLPRAPAGGARSGRDAGSATPVTRLPSKTPEDGRNATRRVRSGRRSPPAGAGAAGHLVSPTLRKTWYTCRKSCLGTPCSPSRFCSNRGSDEATFPTRPGPSPQGPFPGTRLTGRGPPAQSQGRPELCSREGHLPTFEATAHPANYFHVSGKPIWTVSKRGDRFPGSLPCCDRVSAVSVMEQRPLQPTQTLPLVQDHVHHPEACTLAAPSAIRKNRGTPTRRSNLAGGPSAQLSACLPCARHSRKLLPPGT